MPSLSMPFRAKPRRPCPTTPRLALPSLARPCRPCGTVPLRYGTVTVPAPLRYVTATGTSDGAKPAGRTLFLPAGDEVAALR